MRILNAGWAAMCRQAATPQIERPAMNDFPHISAALPLEFAIPAGLSHNGSQWDGPISAETKTATAPGEQRTSDPREVLDAVKRATVVALVRLGGGRRLAAREVGCCHRTIARAAARATARTRADWAPRVPHFRGFNATRLAGGFLRS